MAIRHNHVYLGPENWAGLWRNRHWLMSLFARQGRVLYVEPQRGLRPTVAEWQLGRVSLAPWHWRPLSHPQAGLYVYHQPPFAPVTGLPVLRAASNSFRTWQLAVATARLGLENAIVWISRPWVAELARSFNSCLTIYHVVDEYSAYPGQTEAERARVRMAEVPILRQADLVIVSSRALLEAKRSFNPHTFLVPNGVNYSGYLEHQQRGAPVPAALAAVPRPRLGYLGQIGSKLNFDLLESVARARPGWSLVFVGALTHTGAHSDWERLRALPNVFSLGEVPAARVPEYVCGFDVGLMPYRTSEHTQFIDPLKLYDYLAAGLPIASVDLPALNGYRDLVHVGDTPPEFIRAVEAALQDVAPAAVTQRTQAASANSWEQRMETIAGLIEAHLSEQDVPAVEPQVKFGPEPAGEAVP